MERMVIGSLWCIGGWLDEWTDNLIEGWIDELKDG